MPVKTAARTSVLSKSWLQAWSTIPTLRFDVPRGMGMKFVDVDRTLNRYFRDNIPIERFGLKIDIENQESVSRVEKWIRPVATKTCLKQLFLSVIPYGASFALPDEILSGENLTTIRLTTSSFRGRHSAWMTTPVIKCVSLRELYLEGVRRSEEALHEIFSSCTLLVKIVLWDSCKGLKTIKVKNLPHLYELRIEDDGRGDSTDLEISDVPKLGVFSYDPHIWHPNMLLIPFNAHSISLGSSRATRLWLGSVIKDNACLDMIKTGFPFLESLTLGMTSWFLGSFHFTCDTIKRFSLKSCPYSDVQVHAPKLRSFKFGGLTLPSLLFPVSSLLKLITMSLRLKLPVDASFFLKMREVLTLSHECYLDITTINWNLPLDINIDDDLRKRLLFPLAKNLQQLSFNMILFFKRIHDECMWDQSPFLDAFFEICHPKHVLACAPDASITRDIYFCRLMLSEVLEKKKTGTALWPHYLQDVQIRKDRHQKWETLTNSHRKFLDDDVYMMHFKLIWR